MTGPEDGADRTAGGDGEPAAEGNPADGSRGVVGWLRWFWSADSGVAVYARDVLTSVAAVLLVGLLLFAVSGTWPPMVAVESPSMEPNMNTGDLVFVVDTGRFVPDAAAEHEGRTTGVVPADRAADVGHREFGGYGDVVVFVPNGDEHRTPVIHRAMLFVEEGENWYDRADAAAVGDADDCEELDHCPAPHAGFVTKGDNEDSNGEYDQVSGISEPVRPEWIVGTAELRVPYLGYVRLAFSGQVAPQVEAVTTTGRGSTSRSSPPANDPKIASAPPSSSSGVEPPRAAGTARPIA